MLKIKTETGPKLTAGAFDVAFDEFETVKEAVASFDNPAADGKIFGTDVAISGTLVTVTVKKLDVTGIPPVPWANAKTTDVADMKFTVIADCE